MRVLDCGCGEGCSGHVVLGISCWAYGGVRGTAACCIGLSGPSVCLLVGADCGGSWAVFSICGLVSVSGVSLVRCVFRLSGGGLLAVLGLCGAYSVFIL